MTARPSVRDDPFDRGHRCCGLRIEPLYKLSEQDMALYLEACFAEDPGDGSLIRAALGDTARAKGMSQHDHAWFLPGFFFDWENDGDVLYILTFCFRYFVHLHGTCFSPATLRTKLPNPLGFAPMSQKPEGFIAEAARVTP